MLECLIIGDSIAVGTAQVRQECVSYAHGGWNSWQWNKQYLHKTPKNISAKSVIISLGTNDHDGVNTFKELLKMRENVQADHVYWIMPPIKPHVQNAVESLATSYKDTIIYSKKLSSDKIHPTGAGYKQIANETKEKQ